MVQVLLHERALISTAKIRWQRFCYIDRMSHGGYFYDEQMEAEGRADELKGKARQKANQ